MLEFDQEFSYRPILVEVTEDLANFNVSLERNGTLYGVVLIQGTRKPSPRQIQNGLNASNFKVAEGYSTQIDFVYPENLPYGVRLNQMASFTFLFDNTEYDAHFVGDNDLPVNPDIMTYDEIVTVSFLTQRELFIIPSDYQHSSILAISRILLVLLAGLLLML